MLRTVQKIITVITLVTTLVIAVKELKNAVDAFRSKSKSA